MIPFQDPLIEFILGNEKGLPKSIGEFEFCDPEKSTPSVLPLPVIHTSSLTDAQVLASFSSSQENTGTNIYDSWIFKNNS